MKKFLFLVFTVTMVSMPILADAALETFYCEFAELKGNRTGSLSVDLSMVEDEGDDDLIFPKVAAHLEGYNRGNEENNGIDVKLYLSHEDEEILNISFFVPSLLEEERDFLDMELTKYNVHVKCYAY